MERRRAWWQEAGGGPAAPPTMVAISNLTGANWYATAAGNDGSVLGYSCAAIVSVRTALDAFFKTIWDRDTFNNRGCGFRMDAANMTFRATDGVPTTIISPVRTYVAADLDKWAVLHGVHDVPAGVMRFYFNGAQVGGAPACVGVTPAVARVGSFGCRGNTGNTPASPIVIAGIATWTGVPSAAEITAYYQACKDACDILSTLGSSTPVHHYSVKQSAAGSAPATITDTIGGNDLVKVGAPSLFTEVNPVWI